jgi:pyridoxamine 5'-phosphate oxidase
MIKPFAIPDDLDAVLTDAWARLTRGVRDRRSPFHTPVVATGGEVVRQRVMVLRGADRARATLRFHTDRRAAKVASIKNSASVSVLGYDPAARIQISMQGTGSVMTGADADAFWDATTLSGRRCYLIDPRPGTSVPQPDAGLPPHLTDRVPTAAESEAGRANFAVLMVTIDQIEWLELSASGGRRARFIRRDEAWNGTWLIP